LNRSLTWLLTGTHLHGIQIDWIALFLVVLFSSATGFYAFVRGAYGIAELGHLRGYGAAVLAVELLGAFSVLLYGFWLVRQAVDSGIERISDRQDVTEACLSRRYFVRVLIPCYKEPLQMVRRTVIAALEAVLPPRCSRVVYLYAPVLQTACRTGGARCQSLTACGTGATGEGSALRYHCITV
jgi:hypothetical protein